MEQKKHLKIFIAVILVVIFGVVLLLNIAKINSSIEDVNQTSIESQVKTYKGVLPCADCSGRNTTLVLKTSSSSPSQGTYEMTTIYEGQDVEPLIEKGEWITQRGDAVDPNATVIVLNPKSATDAQRFVVDKSNNLQQLDMNGKPLEIPNQNTSLMLQQ